jgi:hypothetical protein
VLMHILARCMGLVPTEAGGDVLRDGSGVLPTGGCNGCGSRTGVLMHMLFWFLGLGGEHWTVLGFRLKQRGRPTDKCTQSTAHRWVWLQRYI